MEILDDLAPRGYGRGVGPGVYDIHSPRVPGSDEITERAAARAVAAVPARPAVGQPGLRAEDPRLRRGRGVPPAPRRGCRRGPRELSRAGPGGLLGGVRPDRTSRPRDPPTGRIGRLRRVPSHAARRPGGCRGGSWRRCGHALWSRDPLGVYQVPDPSVGVAVGRTAVRRRVDDPPDVGEQCAQGVHLVGQAAVSRFACAELPSRGGETFVVRCREDDDIFVIDPDVTWCGGPTHWPFHSAGVPTVPVVTAPYVDGRGRCAGGACIGVSLCRVVELGWERCGRTQHRMSCCRRWSTRPRRSPSSPRADARGQRAGLRTRGRRAQAYRPSLPRPCGPVLMTAVVPTHRCGAVPVSHRAPLCAATWWRGGPTAVSRYRVGSRRGGASCRSVAHPGATR